MRPSVNRFTQLTLAHEHPATPTAAANTNYISLTASFQQPSPSPPLTGLPGVALPLVHPPSSEQRDRPSVCPSARCGMLMAVSPVRNLLTEVLTEWREHPGFTQMGAFVHFHIPLLREDAFRRSRSPSRSPYYSHFHLRVHVLYYLWSHSETAHCSSPASYQEFVPGKLIREERRLLSCRSNSS